MIHEISIKNLRCFDLFTIDSITPITLISGENNIGKSTLLEGIFLFFDFKTPTVFEKLHYFRGNKAPGLTPQQLWEPLFSNMDSSKELSIAIKNETGFQSVHIQKNDSFAMSSVDNERNFRNLLEPMEKSYALKFSYSNNEHEETGHYFISKSGSMITMGASSTQDISYVQYIGPNIEESPNSISEWIGKLELSGQKQLLVDAMKRLDDRITDLLVVVSNGIGHVYAKMGAEIKRPLRSMGDGINRLMFIALTILANPNSTILIDEIENGFHYSFHPKLWKLINTLSIESNCQIFATTHSYECIKGAADYFGQDADADADRFSYIRLGHQSNSIVPHVFSRESLAYAIESEMEVR